MLSNNKTRDLNKVALNNVFTSGVNMDIRPERLSIGDRIKEENSQDKQRNLFDGNGLEELLDQLERLDFGKQWRTGFSQE